MSPLSAPARADLRIDTPAHRPETAAPFTPSEGAFVSRIRRAVRGLLAACTFILAAGPALAAVPRFQIEGSGSLAFLSGGENLADGHDRRDLYPPAIGFTFTAEFAATEHLWFGFRTGLL